LKGKSAESTAAQLRMMWWGGDARTKAYQAALDAYGRKHPSVTVKTEFSGYDGYFDKLDVEIAADLAADIIQMDTT